ncbi:MAG: histidine phosphatase family protein [Oscillospiraceae bacterium]
MNGYKITFIRNGMTEANEKGIYIGKSDWPLSDKGREELEEKAKVYAYPKVNRVYSSPLTRALQTAEIIFPDREIVICDEMTEMDFGVFEGIELKELLELDSYHNWIKGGLDNPPPNGESLRNMINRSLSGLNLIIMDMMKENIHEAGVVTHSGILMNLMSCFGLPKMKPMEFACEPGEGYMVNVSAMLWQNGGVFEILGKVPFENAADYNEF